MNFVGSVTRGGFERMECGLDNSLAGTHKLKITVVFPMYRFALAEQGIVECKVFLFFDVGGGEVGKELETINKAVLTKEKLSEFFKNGF